MGRITLIVALLGAGLVAVPAAAVAHTDGGRVVRARLARPVTFTNPTTACPQGIAKYRLVSSGGAGRGANCVLNPTVHACPQGSTAFLCQDVPVHVALHLHGGVIRARHTTIAEVWTCADPACATISIRQRWHGSVSAATGRFDDLAGGTLRGGGTALVDATTFEFLRIHEVLAIRADDDAAG